MIDAVMQLSRSAGVRVLGGIEKPMNLQDLAIRTLDLKRLVGHPTGQGVLAGTLKRGEIDRRLDQRANRPNGM